MTRLAAIIIALCITGSALAQVPPYTYPQTIGTSSVSILPADPARGPQQSMPSAWVGIASAPSSNLTIWEFE